MEKKDWASLIFALLEMINLNVFFPRKNWDVAPFILRKMNLSSIHLCCYLLVCNLSTSFQFHIQASSRLCHLPNERRLPGP